MFIIIILGILILLILSHSSLSLYYAFHGLTLWYGNMVPALLPFMIISGIIVKKNMAPYIMKLIQPLFSFVFRVRSSLSYGIFMGFLCGFPMGAKVARDLYLQGLVSKKEAEYLLAFCNNFGPIYMLSFALPVLGLENKAVPALLGFYLIPLIYGIVLRYTLYRDIPKQGERLTMLSYEKISFMQALYDSIKDSIESITMLCGYMVFFNLFNFAIHILAPKLLGYLSPIFEITGGLSILGKANPTYGLVLLSFGGLCCFAQTYSVISSTDLSFGNYIKHKLLQTLLCSIYFLLFFPFL